MNTKTSTKYLTKATKYLAKVKKLACGRAAVIPYYGKVAAYCNSAGVRKFSLSKSNVAPNGGNLSIEIIEKDLKTLFG